MAGKGKGLLWSYHAQVFTLLVCPINTASLLTSPSPKRCTAPVWSPLAVNNLSSAPSHWTSKIAFWCGYSSVE